MAADKFVLLLNLRLSERMPTQGGARLDRLQGLSKAKKLHLAETLALASNIDIRGEQLSRGDAKFTSIMWHQLGMVFGDMYRFDPPAAQIRLALEGVDAQCQVEGVYAGLSRAEHAAAVEGDDLVVCLIVRRTVAPADGAAMLLASRPQNVADAMKLLVYCLPSLGALSLELETPIGKPGFYFLRRQQWGGGESPFLDSHAANDCVFLLASYLFYCYLICQRSERLINGLTFADDVDEQSRKFILLRKKIVVAMRFAYIKNRAEPDSPILPMFSQLLESFRLGAQLENLSELAGEIEKTFTIQESYRSAERLRKIELVLFLFSILSLGVGLNAIQMPPFYIADKNTLLRPEFWFVFGAVFAAAFAIWVGMNQWKRGRRVLRRLGDWIGSQWR